MSYEICSALHNLLGQFNVRLCSRLQNTLCFDAGLVFGLMTLFPDDPRSYLRREYEQRHKRNPAYSWRSFARDLKLSPSMLSEFLKGRYGLSRTKATTIAEVIKLDALNTEHFIDLLEAGFHRLPTQRELARMRAEQRLQKTGTMISRESLRHIMDWSYFAMMEIIGLENGGRVCSDRWLTPFRICAQKAEQAVNRLLELKLVSKDNGVLANTEQVTIAGEQIDEQDTRALHAQVLDLSKLALEGLDAEQRESISVFGSFHEDDFADMRKELNDGLLQILNKYADRSNSNSVFCFTLQAFPVYQKKP